MVSIMIKPCNTKKALNAKVIENNATSSVENFTTASPLGKEQMSLETLKREIEKTWYCHLELRNELYEMDMGPIDILDVFVSCQKTARSSLSREEIAILLESNFRYHMELRLNFHARTNSLATMKNDSETYM